MGFLLKILRGSSKYKRLIINVIVKRFAVKKAFILRGLKNLIFRKSNNDGNKIATFQKYFAAKERYTDFAKTHPSILQRAQLGHIATYLGMNQVTLSRARQQIR
jgi:hypothetical protein